MVKGRRNAKQKNFYFFYLLLVRNSIQGYITHMYFSPHAPTKFRDIHHKITLLHIFLTKLKIYLWLSINISVFPFLFVYLFVERGQD